MKKILVVDADEDNLITTTANLKRNGFEVFHAMDGLEAIDRFNQDKPDLILMAAMLPKLHGFQVCKTIKRSELGKNTPIFIMSAVYKSSLYKYQAMHEFLADEFMQKPLDSNFLIARIRDLKEEDHGKTGRKKTTQTGKIKKNLLPKDIAEKDDGLENLLEKTLASLMDFDEVGYTESSVESSTMLSERRLEDTLVDLMQIKDDTDESLEPDEIQPKTTERVSKSPKKMKVDIPTGRIKTRPSHKKDPLLQFERKKDEPVNSQKAVKDKKSTSGSESSGPPKTEPPLRDMEKPRSLRAKRSLLAEVDEDEIDRIVEEALVFDDDDEEQSDIFTVSKPRRSGEKEVPEDAFLQAFQASGPKTPEPQEFEPEQQPEQQQSVTKNEFKREYAETLKMDALRTGENDTFDRHEKTETDDSDEAANDIFSLLGSDQKDDEKEEHEQEKNDDFYGKEDFFTSGTTSGPEFNEEESDNIFASAMDAFDENTAPEPLNTGDRDSVLADEDLLSLVSENLDERADFFDEESDIDIDVETEDEFHESQSSEESGEESDLSTPAISGSDDDRFLAALETLDEEQDADAGYHYQDDEEIDEDSDEMQEENEYGMAFGKYFLVEKIATGGMAEIFKAKQRGVEGFEKLVAVKRILPHLSDNKDFVSMFIDEGKIAAQLTHQNIAQIYELGEEGKYYYIAMEFVHGKDLKSLMQRAKKKNFPLSIEHAVLIISKLCSGLDYAHRKKDFENRDLNIVHRDISPQNVLISYEGEVKIIDFGIAKAAAKDHHTRAGALKGKILYMSPEQAWGRQIDKRSDIFSLGTLLYEMLTQKRLFLAQSEIQILQKVRDAKVTAPCDLRPDIPKPLEEIILKALAKNPEDRYQLASEMQRDLDIFLYSREVKRSTFDLATYMHILFKEEIEGEMPDSLDRLREVEAMEYMRGEEERKEPELSQPLYEVEEDTVATRQESISSAIENTNDWEDTELKQLLEGAKSKNKLKELLTNPLVMVLLLIILMTLAYFILLPFFQASAEAHEIEALQNSCIRSLTEFLC